MGRRGPSPTPTAILRLHNSIHAARRPGEPKGQPVDSLACPAWLSPAAKGIWRQIAPDLCKMKVLARTDRNALARYCETLVNWKVAQKIMSEKGQVYENAGRLETVPYVRHLGQWHHMLLRLEQEFGLTPSARARINVDHAAANVDGDALSAFVARKHG